MTCRRRRSSSPPRASRSTAPRLPARRLRRHRRPPRVAVGLGAEPAHAALQRPRLRAHRRHRATRRRARSRCRFPDLVGTLHDGVRRRDRQHRRRPERRAARRLRAHRDRARPRPPPRVAATRVRTFQKQTYSDVVATIASEEGLRAEVDGHDDHVRLPDPDDDELRLPRRDRLPHRVRVAGRRHDAASSSRAARRRRSTVTYGEDLRRLKARFTAPNEATNVTVRSWDPLSKTVDRRARATVAERPQPGHDRRHEPALATSGRTDGQAARRRARRLVADRRQHRRGDRSWPTALGARRRHGRPQRPLRVPRPPGDQGRRDGRDQQRRHQAERHVLRHVRRAPLRARRRHDDDVHDRRRRLGVDRRPARRRRRAGRRRSARSG